LILFKKNFLKIHFHIFWFLKIGPGPGGLTRAAVESGASKIVAIEKDSRFMRGLQVIYQQYFFFYSKI
jgi:16S rRNA A1518/A1519 N6-dimethyltransferase RsmA/KsgA/DIM1 with predicted DNA glycosylase/AP lyase activity